MNILMSEYKGAYRRYGRLGRGRRTVSRCSVAASERPEKGRDVSNPPPHLPSLDGR